MEPDHHRSARLVDAGVRPADTVGVCGDRSLEALVAFPELRSRVAAVVTAAGAVGGSALANEAEQYQANLLRHFPKATCGAGDGGAVESLRPGTRKAWLAALGGATALALVFLHPQLKINGPFDVLPISNTGFCLPCRICVTGEKQSKAKQDDNKTTAAIFNTVYIER